MSQKIHIICGPSGSGKSWVAEQMLIKFNYLPHDLHEVEDYEDALAAAAEDSNRPVLGDCPFRTSLLVNTLRGRGFDVEAIYIVEPRDVIERRILQRDGIEGLTARRWKQYEHLKNRAVAFADKIGTSEEILNYLRSK